MKKNGDVTYKLECWNNREQKMEYKVVSPPLYLNDNEVKKWLIEQRIELIKCIENNTAKIPSKVTFSWYYEQVYLGKELNLKPKTLDGYNQLYHRYIKGLIGDLEIRNITIFALVEAQRKLKEQGVGVPTRCAVHRVWRLVLQYAYEDMLIPINPANSRGIAPKPEEKQQPVLSMDELQRFIQEVNKEELFWRTLIYTELFTGIRRGEVAGLMWDDIDLDSGDPRLFLKRNVVIVKGQPLYIGEPKTKSSRRDIKIGEPLISLMREFREESDFGLFVFKSANNPDQPVYPDSITKHFHKISERCGVKCTPHTLRRTLTTVLGREGVSVKVGQLILGHSSEMVTSRYYLCPDRKDRDEGIDTYYRLVNECCSVRNDTDAEP
ncbi:MAG: site-specific integrase [Candidatus Methanomethylophilaceae archaeon]|nr:site-specific integrase [Candidatus Methanomethylophilaceae archaeon]